MIKLVLNSQELVVQKSLIDLYDSRTAMGANEGIEALQQFFTLVIGLGGVKFVSGNDGRFAGAAGQGVVV